MSLLSMQDTVGTGVDEWWRGDPCGRPLSPKKEIYAHLLFSDGRPQGSPLHHSSTPVPTVRENKPYNIALCEDDVARRWWSLPIGTRLPISDGTQRIYYQLRFAGHPGSSAGPDVHDAIFHRLVPPSDPLRIVGDVEFHIRSSDWLTHQHQSDPRYNNVVLHVVLLCDDSQPTRRQDGSSIPICCLNDLPPFSSLPTMHSNTPWPCQQIIPAMSDEERDKLLRRAGILRFEQKSSNYIEQIHTVVGASFSAPVVAIVNSSDIDHADDGRAKAGPYDTATSLLEQQQAYDLCLLTALAEALGYGRDRGFFRAAGLYILGVTSKLPEPLGRMPTPSPLDAQRLRVLHHLTFVWRDLNRSQGAWQGIRSILMSSSSLDNVLDTIRNLFVGFGLSLARTDILLCNVIFPFAAAVALLEHDNVLAERALALYLAHPGLSSNRITRMMSQQLSLQSEPYGSCQQQGLHHIYQETCKEKRCALCIAGRNVL